MASDKTFGQVFGAWVVVAQEHLHILVPCYFGELVGLEDVRQAASSFVPQIMEDQVRQKVLIWFDALIAAFLFVCCASYGAGERARDGVRRDLKDFTVDVVGYVGEYGNGGG